MLPLALLLAAAALLGGSPIASNASLTSGCESEVCGEQRTQTQACACGVRGSGPRIIKAREKK